MWIKKLLMLIAVLLVIIFFTIFLFKSPTKSIFNKSLDTAVVDTPLIDSPIKTIDSSSNIISDVISTNQDSLITDNHHSDYLRDSVVAFSKQLLGVPYVYAGTDRNGFDCSGFVYFVFKNFNIKTPRSSAAFEFFGTELPLEKVKNGDILLFKSPTREAIGHIGIVSNAKGTESEFIHATSSKQMQVVVSSAGSDGYKKRFIKALRVIN